MPYICKCGKKTCRFDRIRECNSLKRDVSVILPTYNEAGNIEKLITSLSAELKDYNFEIVIVDDDSTDKTPEIMDKYAKKGVVVALHRKGIRGIFSAIRDGIKISCGNVIVLMDADMSHPPETVPELVKHTKQYDLVSASRYTDNKSVKAPFIRKFFPIMLNLYCKTILRMKLTDFTGGFHAIRREKLKEIQFKYPSSWGEFDLELLFRARNWKIKEIPFVYSYRTSGTSKSAEGMGYVKFGLNYGIRALQLRFGEIIRYLVFVVGGGLGMLINLVVTFLLTEFAGLWYMGSYALGLGLNMLFNFFYHRHVTFNVTSRAKERFGKFMIVTVLIVLINWLMVYAITEITGIYYILSIILVTLVVSVINYILNKLWVFKD
ncbi:MAG: glycosyltransferase [bacterium]|nr:glycosyltransferase [bacterium]